MRYAILYLEDSDKARFFDLKNRVENDYVFILVTAQDVPYAVILWYVSKIIYSS